MSGQNSELMSAWKLHDYNGITSVKLVENLPIPQIKKVKDVLIEVRAASVNVLDVMMADGYGRVLFEKVFSAHLPLILGRDFAGVVKAVGKEVKEFKAGDEVMGVVIPQSGTGSHAQFIVVPSDCVVMKPPNLTMIEAASIPYAGLTAWAGLKNAGGLSEVSNGKQVLVMGAAGGVGSIAIQLAKLWGSNVTATCSTGSVAAIENFGADLIVDYKQPDSETRLHEMGSFHVVMDCTGRKENYDFTLLKSCANAKYLTLIPPVLNNFDTYGLFFGLVKTVYDLIASNILLIFSLKTLRWVLFAHTLESLTKLRDYAQNDQLKPLIDSVFSYDQLHEAYAKMKEGHSRGKIVIEIKK